MRGRPPAYTRNLEEVINTCGELVRSPHWNLQFAGWHILSQYLSKEEIRTKYKLAYTKQKQFAQLKPFIIKWPKVVRLDSIVDLTRLMWLDEEVFLKEYAKL